MRWQSVKVTISQEQRLYLFNWHADVIVSSRVCTVAQYAVLEANAKVNGKCENLHPRPSKTPVPIWTPFEIYYYIQPGIQCAKFDVIQFSRYGSAHA